MKLSIIIPARNEEGAIENTVLSVAQALGDAQIDHEVIIINDGSTDRTEEVLRHICLGSSRIRYFNNPAPNGFGLAVRRGLENYTGDAVCVVMGDGSDDPQDIVLYYRKLQEGYECVFGSRFISGSKVLGYPFHKLVLNRLANGFIRGLFALPHNDMTNSFKCYRREVLDGCKPFLSHHFNLTVELPLKSIVRGYTYSTVPISWTCRQSGFSKLRIKEMGGRYLFIVLYLFLEKILCRGDYFRRDAELS